MRRMTAQHRRDLRIIRGMIKETPSVRGWEASRASQEMVLTDRKHMIVIAATLMGFTASQLNALRRKLSIVEL